jgi:hypothetical protein
MLNKAILQVHIPASNNIVALELMEGDTDDGSRCACSETFTWRTLKGLPAAEDFAQFCRRFGKVELRFGLGNPTVYQNHYSYRGSYSPHVIDRSSAWNRFVSESFAVLSRISLYF